MKHEKLHKEHKDKMAKLFKLAPHVNAEKFMALGAAAYATGIEDAEAAIAAGATAKTLQDAHVQGEKDLLACKRPEDIVATAILLYERMRAASDVLAAEGK